MMEYRVKRSGDDEYIVLYIKHNGRLGQLELSHWEDNTWYINRLIVHPAVRKQGIAAALMKELIRIAYQEHLDLMLEVFAYGEMSNQDLKAFFTRFGFTESGSAYIRKSVESN